MTDQNVSEDYIQKLTNFRNMTTKHFLLFEPISTFYDRCRIFHYAKLINIISRELLSIYGKRTEQLMRTKKFRGLKKARIPNLEAKDKESYDLVVHDMQEMMLQYNVTRELFDKSLLAISQKYNVDYVFSAPRGDEIWANVINFLFRDGADIRLVETRNPFSITTSRMGQGLILGVYEYMPILEFNDMFLGFEFKNLFQRRELAFILKYLESPNTVDKNALDIFLKTGKVLSTYRPCNIKLICSHKNSHKPYVDIQILVEGTPLYQNINDSIQLESVTYLYID